VDRVFEWLGGGGEALAEPYQWIITILLLLVFLLVFVRQFLYHPGVVVCFSTSFMIALGVAYCYPLNPHQTAVPQSMNIALIDNSHLNRYSLEPLSPDNIYGLISNLQRNNYFPLLMPDLSEASLEPGKILVIIAPAKPYNAGEIKIIKNFLAGGGMVLIAAGWDPSGVSEGLLREFGTSIVNKPLGRTTAVGEGLICSIWSGWPVTDRDQKSQVLAEAYREAVAVSKSWGEGTLIVIGDADFLLNKNLEAAYRYDETNILFLKEILDMTRQRQVKP
jgi:hypothetical protein